MEQIIEDISVFFVWLILGGVLITVHRDRKSLGGFEITLITWAYTAFYAVITVLLAARLLEWL